MRKKAYRVQLTAEEEKQLAGIISKGVHPARQITRARVLLLLNEKTGREGKPAKIPEQTEVAQQCGCHTMLVYRVSREYAREGLGRVLNRKKRETPPVPAKVTGKSEGGEMAVYHGRRLVSCPIRIALLELIKPPAMPVRLEKAMPCSE
jgi:hypothetical protein